MKKNKVMWVTNIILPEPAKALNLSAPYGGSWLVKSSKTLSLQKENNLVIIFPHQFKIDIEIDNIRYISFNVFSNKRKLLKKVSPDIIHIYGTEMKHSYEFSELAKEDNIPIIVHIQGLISEVHKVMDYRIPKKIKYSFTIRDLIKLDNIFLKTLRYRLRGFYEKKTINNADWISGRTLWDKSLANRIRFRNKKRFFYHDNPEMLRQAFYDSEKWQLKSAVRYRIFISQGHYPAKGLHTLIPELYRLKQKYPLMKVYISGRKIHLNSSLKIRAKETMYERFIRNQLIKYKLLDTVVFTGPLSEHEMIEQYLKATLVVTPSLIENSPNSLAEALYLGVPTVSTYTGGIPSMTNEINPYYYYDYKTPEMFYETVISILDNDDELKKISKSSIEVAEKIYNVEKINNKTLLMYNKILKGETC